MFNIEGDQFQQGDELIWTHKNATRENVVFLRFPEAIPAATTDPSISLSHREALAILQRFNGSAITVPLCELFRPK